MQISIISSLDTREICKMNSKSNNVEIMMGNETDVTKKLFESFNERYHEGLEKKWRGGAILFLKVLIYCNIVFTKHV